MQTPSSHKMKHLKDFYSPSPQLFQDATSLPQFFKTNLVDDSRVVKYFPNDPQANLRIFYYQYLKLCFEIDNVDYESYIQKIYELIRTEGFEFYFEQNDTEKQFKNAQYKSLLIDFFEVMNSSSLTIDQILVQYPILDEVFINFFRSVLMIASVTFEYDSYIDKNQLFDFLSSFFSVDISSYDKCLKFVQSDIFVYEEDPQNIYMAYITDDDEDYEERQGNQPKEQNYSSTGTTAQQNPIHDKPYCTSEQSSHNSLPEDNKQPVAPSSSEMTKTAPKTRAKIMIKESYIEGEFADYTSYNHNVSAFAKNVPIESEKQITETIEHQTASNQQIQQVSTRFQEIVAAKNINQPEKQLKRVLSAENYVKVEEQTTENTNQGYQQKPNSFNKGYSQPNLTSFQNNHRMIESIYDPLEMGIHTESKEQIQHEDPGNLKQGKKDVPLNRNLLYLYYEEPTKDPGFGSAQGINVRSVDSTIYHAVQSKQMFTSCQSNLVESEENSYKQGKSTFHEQSQKLTHLYLQEPLFHKPSIPVPTLMNPNSLSSLNANSRTVASSKHLKDSPSPGNANLASVKESLKLNVTKEFTNSFVMESMDEPFKTNVHKIREKAREFRKNIYQEFTYQSSNFAGSNEHKMAKYQTSKTDFVSNSTLEKVSASNNLGIDSNVKPKTQVNVLQNELTTKQESGFNNSPAKKIFEVKQTTPSSSEESSKAIISSPFRIQDGIKESNQSFQVSNKKLAPIGLGPSIVVSKQSQPQINQFSQVHNSYHLAQPNTYQVATHQMNRPQTYQQGRAPTSPTMLYSNNLQTIPVNAKLYDQRSIHMYKQQLNMMNPYNGQTLRNSNPHNMMHPQSVKRPNPMFVAYERRT